MKTKKEIIDYLLKKEARAWEKLKDCEKKENRNEEYLKQLIIEWAILFDIKNDLKLEKKGLKNYEKM